MSSIKISPNASGTGEFVIAAPNSNTNRTLTLPDATGTIITTASTFAGTGPAFRAYQNSNQTITLNTTTVVSLQAETFDTASCFDTSTYRFTPNVAGYYNFYGHIGWNSAPATTGLYIFKNGSEVNRGTQDVSTPYGEVSCFVNLNGSTDYVDLRVYGSTTQQLDGRSVTTFFQGYLARAA
jgi:hypothetical protein